MWLSRVLLDLCHSKTRRVEYWAHLFHRWLQSANSIYFQGISQVALTTFIKIHQQHIYNDRKEFLFSFSSFSFSSFSFSSFLYIPRMIENYSYGTEQTSPQVGAILTW